MLNKPEPQQVSLDSSEPIGHQQPTTPVIKMPTFQAGGAVVKGLMRNPQDDELDYFKNNPNVTGMATDDNRIILNPFSKLTDKEKELVALNEAARIKMRTDAKLAPNFELTPAQVEFLNSNTYKQASDQDRKATIAARILTGDPSAGTPTEEQNQFVDRLHKSFSDTEEPTKMANGGDVVNKEEAEFQKEIKKTGWYKEYVKEYGEEPNLNTPDYDYRAAWKAGVRPVRDPNDKNRYHWSSSNPETGEMLKSKDHPTAWKEEYMRKTGKNPDEVGVTKEQAGMAKGGQVRSQTQRMLKKGGMMQEGGTVDPVSGNDVPVGAMQEEVRDDIPAQLSEGEFVFPADVVRFIGLERLMMMRQAAKEGLGKMEAMGQMSNADEATEEDTGEFESKIDEIMGELGEEKEEEVKMQAGGDVRAQVGEPTGEMSEAGRPLYKTADGETVSEKSITVPFAGEWANVPSIHDGVRYEDDEIEDMLASGKIKPTSTHKNLDEAVAAAKARSNTLIKPKMQAGGMVEQTQQALSQDQQTPEAIPTEEPPTLTPEQMATIQDTAKSLQNRKINLDQTLLHPSTEGLSSSTIVTDSLAAEGYQGKPDVFLRALAIRAAQKKAAVARFSDTVFVGVPVDQSTMEVHLFTKDDPKKLQDSIKAGIQTLQNVGTTRIQSTTTNANLLSMLKKLQYPMSVQEDNGTFKWTMEIGK